MTSNFSFLERSFPALAKLGSLAEKYCYSDSNSCISKLGYMGETIVNLMYDYDNLDFPADNKADKRINKLLKEGMIAQDICDILHILRKKRNLASHQNYESVDDAKNLLKMAHSLAEWFMITYGDYGYIPQKFVMPVENEESQTITVAEKAKENAEEQQLIDAAQKAAKAAPKTDISERKTKAEAASKKRTKSEAETRYIIDEQLRKVGWEADTENLRYSKGTRPQKGRNLAIAEYPFKGDSGKPYYADYVLFIGTQMVGIIEAKAEHKTVPSVIDTQCKRYATNLRDEDAQYVDKYYGKYCVPFVFATNGRPYLEQLETMSGIWSLDLRSNSNIPKALRGWMSPQNITEELEKNISAANTALASTPYDLLTDKDGLNLRRYQLDAIKAAEDAIINGKDRVLLAMATGTGKTRTVLGMIYRFLSANRFKRILFLVDRTALGTQASDVFGDVKLENLKSLNDIYNIQKLEDKLIEKETRLQIATVQSMVQRVLYDNDDTAKPGVNDYDLIIVDEAHRGYILDKEMSDDELLYRDQLDYQSKYRSVIEYFTGVKIALTATPALQTTQIFGEPVYTYSYREAVIEGYLVDHDAPHIIKTKLSTEGIHYKKGDYIDFIDPTTGELKNAALMNDELNFDVDSFNRQVITPEFNKVVLQEIAKNIDPESPREYGKTLIYAVNDDHATLIVDILKHLYEETGVSNEAVMKITGKAGNKKDVDEAIKKFKNEDYPSIAVTVDLLTTGIDVPEITALVFLRRVKSRILFEQMIGRATRLCPELNKSSFDIYDAVGVYESLEAVTSMKPVAVDSSTTISALTDTLIDLTEEDAIKADIEQIIAKFQRKQKAMKTQDIDNFVDLTGGIKPNEFVQKALSLSPTEAKDFLSENAAALKFMDSIRIRSGYIVVSHEEDELLDHSRGYEKGTKPEDYIQAFTDFIKTNINTIDALSIVCTRPSDLTRDALKSLMLTLDREGFTAKQLNTAISSMSNADITADIISIIRRYAIGSVLVSHDERIKNAITKLKNAHNFSKQELTWINRIETYLLKESVFNVAVFDTDDRFKSNGGFNRINKIFQNNLTGIVAELNSYLYDDGGESA